MKGLIIRGTQRLGRLLVAPVVVGVVVGATALAPPAQAAFTFTVDSFDDRRDINPSDNICRTSAGNCSLRAAVQQANASAGADTIRLTPGNYRLGYAGGVRQSAATVDPADNFRDLDITSSVTIIGDGSVIDGGRFNSVFEIDNAATVHLSDLTVTNGGEDENPPFIRGGGLNIWRDSMVRLTRVTVRDNVTTMQGSGIANAGVLTLVDSRVEDNRNLSPLGGGGVTANGGGIFNYSTGLVNIDRSTISNNFSLRGGGINNDYGRVTITNSTISGNTARNSGGGILNRGDGTATKGILNVAFSTIVGNQANVSGADPEKVGGGIANFGGQVNMGGTILAGNEDNRSHFDAAFAPDCHSPDTSRFTSHRYNVVGLINGRCAFEQRFDKVGWDGAAPLNPRVGALGFNGGGTATRMPLAGSPAVDFGSSVTSSELFDCPATDQRGVSRPRDGDANGTALCDSGAVEIG
ncbi:choice-of-anchor Q domain-containing protein [Micromonospora sp. KC721]|uniref:choice-of-anchor Q domain-containing protein n=1 Tax=Micromonospora sp. KC721 TaxID=2530380 RepID=UPI00104C2FEF|nr:choice-of-anchor Q domain-containing protein [Micromonospora sp. KC721]TDB78840.1 hypothetical protein E1182_14690 [Micromonospora sp. KC721]